MDNYIGAKVFIYWNIRKRCWSVRYHGKVVEHVYRFAIENVEFKVSEAGRQRVLRTRRKNVHAGVVGTLTFYSTSELFPIPRNSTYGTHVELSKSTRVTYNPYKTSFFHPENTPEIPVNEADMCLGFETGKIYAAEFANISRN